MLHRKLVFFISILCLSNALLGQMILKTTKVKNGEEIFEWMNKIAKEKMLSQEELISASSEGLPEGFLDTMRKYIWIDLAEYDYIYQKYSNFFDQPFPNRIQIRLGEFNSKRKHSERTFDKMGEGEFVINAVIRKDKTKPLMPTIQWMDGKNLIIFPGSDESVKTEIVSFQNGVIILEIEVEKLGWKRRIAQFAIPKIL